MLSTIFFFADKMKRFYIVNTKLCWIKTELLDFTCFFISLFQQISRKLVRMYVLTSETCWALNNEIKKQVTSSWSLSLSLFNYQDDARSNKHKITKLCLLPCLPIRSINIILCTFSLPAWCNPILFSHQISDHKISLPKRLQLKCSAGSCISDYSHRRHM